MFPARDLYLPGDVRKGPALRYVSLQVGDQTFMGEGLTHKAAKENAAEEALFVLESVSGWLGLREQWPSFDYSTVNRFPIDCLYKATI